MKAWELLAVIGAGIGLWWANFRRFVPAKVPAKPPVTTSEDEPGQKSSSYPGTTELDDRPWVQLSTGPVWSVRNASRSWVTPATFDALVSALLRYAELDATPVVILDASKKGGGSFPPHRSHREGRDVDLRFKDVDMPTRPLAMLLRALIVDARLQAVFLGWSVQKKVWELIKADPGLDPPPHELAAELQYPLAPGTGQTRIRNWPGHLHHLHVRYRS